ncbi:uncharacterized protein LOC110738165 [Chenopodium quinoa]|uniref:uncharacterized protein LOC110738165 n=1 Tax=Chenopodium quinoa TaxID=63459 RepID=UPI000B7881A7|nr:uncharacterized protein LOC110738165 [Chenopodium quinoa]
MRRALIAKWKYGFVDGSMKKPAADFPQRKHWKAVNSMLVSWISNTLDESLRSTIEDYDYVSELWVHLQQRYCVVSGTRVCQLKNSLGECKQTSTESVTEYFGRLSKIWTELLQYSRIPKCSCGQCTCNIAKQVGDIRDEDY